MSNSAPSSATQMHMQQMVPLISLEHLAAYVVQHMFTAQALAVQAHKDRFKQYGSPRNSYKLH